jgi:hypothetical protein
MAGALATRPRQLRSEGHKLLNTAQLGSWPTNCSDPAGPLATSQHAEPDAGGNHQTLATVDRPVI